VEGRLNGRTRCPIIGVRLSDSGCAFVVLPEGGFTVTSSLEKLGGRSLMLGSVLLAVYAVLFAVLVPRIASPEQYARAVLDPSWVPLAALAFAGVLLLLPGLLGVYLSLRTSGGIAAAIGFVLLETGCVLEACRVTWELFLDPIIASHAGSAFLLRDGVIFNSPAVAALRIATAIATVIGAPMLCFALFRSNRYPKAAALCILGGALSYAVGAWISVVLATAGLFSLSGGCLLVGKRLAEDAAKPELPLATA
jgi:hypothetical protein